MSHRSGHHSEYLSRHTHDHGRTSSRRPATAHVSSHPAETQQGYTLIHAGKQVRFGPVVFWIVVGTVTVLGMWSAATATSGNRGDDRYLVALGDGGVEALGEADIGVIDIDVDELPQASGVVIQAIVEARIGCIEVGEHGTDGAAIDAHLGIAGGEPAEWTRNADCGCH